MHSGPENSDGGKNQSFIIIITFIVVFVIVTIIIISLFKGLFKQQLSFRLGCEQHR